MKMTVESPAIVVAYPEDVVLEFLSVLAHNPDRNVLVVVASHRRAVVLPPSDDMSARLGAVSNLAADTTQEGLNLISDRDLASLVKASLPESCIVWTHCPADHRRARAGVAWTVARIVRHDAVIHAVGWSTDYQILSDIDVTLSPEQVKSKFTFAAQALAPLLRSPVWDRRITTETVPSTERFFKLDRGGADRLYALLHSVEDDASISSDPWDFQGSAYEHDRLESTLDWAVRWCPPARGRIVEVGACEGAFTTRLLRHGYHVIATEPNARFRERLIIALRDRVSVRGDSLEDLAEHRHVPAAAYLLVEMLYYGQHLSLLDRLPTDMLFVALDPDELYEKVVPAMTANSQWRVVSTDDLVQPRLDFVYGEKVYKRKEGSSGIVCVRAGTSSLAGSATAADV
jgi:hypothetical protein